MGDPDLTKLVEDELHRHPDVDAAAIAVYADDGCVTLRGTVGSTAEKAAAGEAARDAFGVVVVENELEVTSLNARGRQDAELRARVLEALMADAAVPRSVDVRVADGFVTLTGTAERPDQCTEAEIVARSTLGVRGVAQNDIVIN
jgi:osmotically-inducible protein OsmY